MFDSSAQVQLLQYYFNGLTPGAVPAIYVALHDADPTGGTQATGETTYAGYARLGVAPSPSTFLVTSGPPAFTLAGDTNCTNAPVFD